LTRGIDPSIATFNAVIDSCARNGRMDAVDQLLKDLRARNLEPNLITYSTMIKGYSQKGDMQSALQKLQDLRSTTNLRPDEIVFNTLLDGCSSAGLHVEGERLLAEMRAEGICPSNYTLTVMVRVLGQARRLDRALELVEEITTRYRFKANSHVVGALIQACITSRDLKHAVAVYEKAQQERVSPDSRTGQMLVRSLLASGSTVQAINVLRPLVCNGGSAADRDRGGGNERQPTTSVSQDDAFINEVLGTLLDRGADGVYHANELYEELRSSRPRFRCDNAVERKFASMSSYQ